MEGTGSDDVFFVSLQYKGSAYQVPVQAEDSVASIFDFAQEALDFPRENCKLIFRGRMLRPDHDATTVGDAGFQAGSKLMLVASSAHDVSFVQSSRADPLVKGFAEEERDEAARKKRARAAAASAWGTKQDQQYRFRSIKAEFKYTEPPPFEAEKLLQRLATDPGIIDIMKSRRFEVGILTEMSPVEAQERMAKRGTPNMDLLGYNQNAGEMIVLRLRTDNLKGFRPYHDLINTLIHELTHNVWGPHDHNFWTLYGELKAQYMRFHRFWSHGGHAADSSAAGGQFQGFTDDGDDAQAGDGASGGFGRTLGAGDGSAAPGAMSPRSRAAMAAAARAAMGNGPNEPPKPNFLAGDGTWVIMCPCGQVHDPAGCEVAQAAARRGSEAAAAEEKEEAEPADSAGGASGSEQAIPSNDNPVEPGPTPSSSSTSPPPSTSGRADASVSTGGDAGADEVGDAAPAQVAGGARSNEAAAAVPPGADVTMAPAEPGGAADPDQAVARSLDPLTAVELGAVGLDIGDLEAQGLDGASVWLASFSQRLRALRDRGGVDKGMAPSKAVIELLLRMVRNIVNSPGEQKFRRIRADNPKIRSELLGAGGEVAEALMRMLGFEAVEDQGARVFVLRDAAFDSARLHMGKELLEMELEAVTVASA